MGHESDDRSVVGIARADDVVFRRLWRGFFAGGSTAGSAAVLLRLVAPSLALCSSSCINCSPFACSIGWAYVMRRYSCSALRSLSDILRMLTDFEAHDDDDRLDTADAEASEKAAVDEVSDAPDDEQADEMLSPVLLLLLLLMLALVCVCVVKSGEFSGSHSSDNLQAKRERESQLL